MSVRNIFMYGIMEVGLKGCGENDVTRWKNIYRGSLHPRNMGSGMVCNSRTSRR